MRCLWQEYRKDLAVRAAGLRKGEHGTPEGPKASGSRPKRWCKSAGHGLSSPAGSGHTFRPLRCAAAWPWIMLIWLSFSRLM